MIGMPISLLENLLSINYDIEIAVVWLFFELVWKLSAEYVG